LSVPTSTKGHVPWCTHIRNFGVEKESLPDVDRKELEADDSVLLVQG
jgi:hypothetical protein